MHPLFKDIPLWFQFILLALLLLCCTIITGYLILIMPAGTSPAKFTVGEIGQFLLPSLLFASLVYVEPLKEGGFRAVSNPIFYLIAFLIALAAIPLVQILAEWNAGLSVPTVMTKLEKVQDDAIAGELNMPSLPYMFQNLFVMALVPAVCEEAFFRGVMQKILIRGTRSILVGVLLTSIIFSAMHLQFLGFFSRVVLSIILGYLCAYGGSLWPSILGHFVYNGSQVVYFYIQQHLNSAHPNPLFASNAHMPLSWGLTSTFLVVVGLLWMKRLKPATWP